MASLVLALAACASRGGDEIVDDGSQAWTDISAEATDETGETVVNQALLHQARDELAVLSQPATEAYLETLAASRAPRSINESATAGAPASPSSPSAAQGAQARAEIDRADEPAQASNGSAANASVAASEVATTAAGTTAAGTTAVGASAAVTAVGAAGSMTVDQGGQPFQASAADRSEAADQAEASGLAAGAIDDAAPAVDAAPARSRLPGPGEPGYILSGHSTGAMRLDLASDGSGAMLAQADQTVATPVEGRSTLAEVEAPSVAPVVVTGAAGLAGASQMSPAPAAAGSGAEAPTLTAALGRPAPTAAPSFAEVSPLDETMLERGSFATLMGAMHGMVERCEPPTQMRDQALKTFRSTYPAVDLQRGDRDNSAVRLRYDEEFARSAAATLGSERVNCDYVRSQSYGWNQLVGDLRHMSRDSARQYRPGLITEISRGAGLGRF